MGVFRDGLKHLKYDLTRKDHTVVEKIRLLLLSHKWHAIIIFLVIVDIICITMELLLVELERVILPDQEICPSTRNNSVDFPFYKLEESYYNNNTYSTIQGHARAGSSASKPVDVNPLALIPFNSSIEIFNNLIGVIADGPYRNETFGVDYVEVFFVPETKSSIDGHKIFKTLEKIFIWASTIILGIFVVEIFFKIAFVPKIFKKKLEILDVIVVFVSFGMNVTIIALADSTQALAAIFALFRLWRIAEIISDIIVSNKRKFAAQEEKLLKRIAELEGVDYVSKKELEEQIKKDEKKTKKKFVFF